MIMNLSKCEILRCVNSPLHIVANTGIKTSEILFRYNMVIVEVKDMVEEMTEFLFLEVWQQHTSLKILLQVILCPLNESTPGMLHPSFLDFSVTLDFCPLIHLIRTLAEWKDGFGFLKYAECSLSTKKFIFKHLIV